MTWPSAYEYKKPLSSLQSKLVNWTERNALNFEMANFIMKL